MDDEKGYIELIERARAGDKKSMEALAGRVRGRLYAYVYRIVLKEDLAQDIVQETMLEMFRVLGKLEKADRFWPWLRAIAFSKLRRHHSREKLRRTISVENSPGLAGPARDADGGLARLVAEELRNVVLGTMRELKPQYRRVLTMRCYEDMAYSEIAELMGCSELTARVTFCRAKRTLQKRLSRKGFGRGFLVTALVLFGKMTAQSEAAAAGVSITAATTKAGVAASLAALATSKSGMVSLAAAGIIAAGTVAVTSWPEGPAAPGRGPGQDVRVPGAVGDEAEGAEECWYYYPLRVDGPVMMRLVKWDRDGRGSYCQWWQDGGPNYYFDKSSNTIYINNHRIWDSNLAVFRLPTDSENLRDFISMVEGGRARMEYVSADGPGLLVIARQGDKRGNNGSRAVRHYSLLDEEYFRYKWPPDAKVVDRRDAMHKRGWTYFRVAGRIGADEVVGSGRIPFVFAASQDHFPWLRIKVGERLLVEDGPGAACVYDGGGRLIGKYAPGSFFNGLGRPWMGLHTIDTVRRDAAAERLWFDTRHGQGSGKAEVGFEADALTLLYKIDLVRDIVEEIEFEFGGLAQAKGRMTFSYLENTDQVDSEFVAPRQSSSVRYQRDRLGMRWLIKLVEGGW